MCKSLIDNNHLARDSIYQWIGIVLATFCIETAFAGTKKTCNDSSIDHIRSAWFSLNTYIVDNRERTSKNQSFSYEYIGNLAYDVGQIVHVFDGVNCYKVIEFLIELRSYSITDSAISEELSSMIRKKMSEAKKAARVFSRQPTSPCLQWYEKSRENLLNEPFTYCTAHTYWKELLQGYLSDSN